jgi:2-polyprenyl-3-methyl-5-hydroxy-6-metoxy-1,4-benzoquinol methylase
MSTDVIQTKQINKEELKRYREDFNRTHLSVETAMQRVQLHRDYIAHAARYSHVVGKHLLSTKTRKLNEGNGPTVLDIGCGPELQLLNSMHCNRVKCAEYVGLEAADKFKTRGTERLENTVLSGKSNSLKGVELHARADFLTHDFGEDKTFDTIVCLEVIEHVQPWQARAFLERSRDLMHDDSVFWVSTPCYDEKTGAADNHPNEMTYEALGALMEDLGYEVEEVYGTFASQKDYKHLIGTVIPKDFFDKLSAYYDTTLVSNMLAPVVGAHLSRNALWKLKKTPNSNHKRRFTNLEDVDGPWTNNENWKELAGR